METILFNKNNTKMSSKWGDYISDKGWVAIPLLLIRNQNKLGITSSELNVIILLLSYWWDGDNLPFPSKKSLSSIIGCDISTIRRNLKSLETKGLIKREYRKIMKNGSYYNKSNKYNFDGLIEKLTSISLLDDFEKKYAN